MTDRTAPADPREALTPDEEATLRAKWAEFLEAVDPIYHPTGVVPRLLATLDRDRDTLDSLTAERRELRAALTEIADQCETYIRVARAVPGFREPEPSTEVARRIGAQARAALSEGGSK